jgi:hypothetical protein
VFKNEAHRNILLSNRTAGGSIGDLFFELPNVPQTYNVFVKSTRFTVCEARHVKGADIDKQVSSDPMKDLRKTNGSLSGL